VDFVDRLDPELAAVLPTIPRLDLTDLAAARAEHRELAAKARARWTPPSAVSWADRTVPGLHDDADVRLRIYTPEVRRDSVAVLYWMHGGGHVMGELGQDDRLLCEIVEVTGAICVSVDLRWSPEAPYPASLDDSLAGLYWVHDHAAELGIDPTRIVVGGASSGGGLAAGLALRNRDEQRVDLGGQILICPMLDDRQRPDSADVDHPLVWNRASNRIAWQAYLRETPGDDVPPYAAPARAANLGGLPRTWIAAAGLDLFVDEDLDYARRLIAAGVPTELHVYPGAMHGFDLFAPHAAVSQRFLAERTAALQRFLAPTS